MVTDELFGIQRLINRRKIKALTLKKHYLKRYILYGDHLSLQGTFFERLFETTSGT